MCESIRPHLAPRLPSYAVQRALLQQRLAGRVLEDGTFALAGRQTNEVHHAVSRMVQKDMQKLGIGVGVDVDTSPGYLTSFERHRGKGPNSIENVLKEYLPTKPKKAPFRPYTKEVVKRQLQRAYNDPRLNMPDVAEVVIKWIDQVYK